MGTVLGVLAILVLFGVAYVGVSFAIDPTGPDFEEMFFAAGLAIVGVAVAGILIAATTILNEAHIRDHQELTHRHAHGGTVAPAPRPTGTRSMTKTQPAKAAKPLDAPPATTRTPSSPFGDIHPVIDVEGVGDVYEKKLGAMGIVDTEQLWKADPKKVADNLDVPLKTAQKWHAMAELMALDGIGPQYAELLVRAGITSIHELANTKAEAVLDQVQQTEEGRDVRIQGNQISIKYTRRWVRTAKEHDPKVTTVRG